VEDLVPQEVALGELRLPLLVPRDAEALLDEEAFAHEEFLPYWAELWPSGVALGRAVAAARPGGRVVEVGCGLGIPSLAAALGGAAALATDWAPDAVALLRRNAERAGARLEVRRWSWTEDAAVLGGPFDLVLAADVLYEARNGPPLLAALRALVAPAGAAWIADPGRPAAQRFFTAAREEWEVARAGAEGSVTLWRLSRPRG
jgi:predicted nicotinamide N-methyase